MFQNKINNLPVFLFRNLAGYKSSVIHFITTRKGGFSKASFRSLNLAGHVGDSSAAVEKNRRKLAVCMEVPFMNFFYAEQRHSSNVKIISKRNSRAVLSGSCIIKADSLVTDLPGRCLMIQVGDCVPVLLFDPGMSVIASVHAGWRGTVKKITAKTVEVLVKKYGCDPDNIIAGIGPSIGPCCYEVGDEVMHAFKKCFHRQADLVIRHGGKNRWFLDLRKSNRLQLLGAGLKEKNIETARLCTKCHHNLFFSRRYQKRETGRFASGIMLRA
jgi:polyphenol oxidase